MFRTILTYQPLLFALLLEFVFVRRCASGFRARAAWTVVLFLCALKFIVFRFAGGDAFAPELPEKLIWLYNWAYSGMCLLLLFSVVLFFLPRKVKVFAFPAAAWLIAAAGVYNGIKLPALHETALEFPSLPESLEGYRILHISDVHASAAAARWRTEALVRLANSAKPDLIVVTGDLVDGKVSRQARNLEPIRELSAPDGVFHCTGNHEYYHGWRRWKAKFDEWGMRFLDGECVKLRPDIEIAGTRDPACILEGLPLPQPVRVFGGPRSGAFRIYLQHRPWLDDKKLGIARAEDFDLQFSGHTHGGVAPAMDWIVAKANGGFLRGVYDIGGGRKIAVSRGAGQWAGFPVRFFDDPEITLFVLKRGGGRDFN